MKLLHVGYITNDKNSGVSVVVPEYLREQVKDNRFSPALLNLCSPENDGFKKRNSDLFDVFYGDSIYDLPDCYNIPDLIVFHEIYRVGLWRISKEAENNKIPSVIIPHGSLSLQAQTQKKIAKKILNHLYVNDYLKRSASVQFLSEREKKASASFSVNESFVIGNGIENAERYNGKRKKQIVFIGRLDIYIKGLDVLTDSVNLARECLRENQYRIIICGPSQNGSYEELQNKIKKIGIEDIVFLKNGIYGDEKKKLLSSSMLYIQLSRTEALPTSILEAMSYSLPVIVTPGTSFSEVVSKNDLGCSVNYDPEVVARAIERMILRSDLAECGARASEYVRKNYSWTHVLDRQAEMYSRVANEKI